MNIVIFDTETISIEKPFCYNIGYTIVTDKGEMLIERDFVVEQIWHNTALFNTAYYANKRPIYVSRMRGRKTIMDKYGYICQTMCRDFKTFEVEAGFAYNSEFDERVFEFNCDWYKCINPFDNIPIFDIRGYVHKFIAFTQTFQNFCDTHKLYTESGNYSTTAETLFKYISQQIDFVEEHTALSDSRIEKEILFECLSRGAILGEDYKALRSIPRNVDRIFQVKKNGEIIFKNNCAGIIRKNNGYTIVLK